MDVNKQLLDAAKEMLVDVRISQNNMRHAAGRDAMWQGCAEAIQPRVDALQQAIAAAEQAQQAEPVALDVIAKLVALARAVNIALDDSEERDGADGREHVIGSVNFDAVCNALDALEELPDNKPGWAMNAADKAAWALRHITVAAQPPAAAAVPVNQQLLAEVVTLLESHQKWLNKLPVPTTGAAHQMMNVVGKAIGILGGMKSAGAVPDGYALSADAKRYHALREAVISAANGERHPVESAITAAMREAHAKNGDAAPDFDAIDRAIDECIAAAQKGGAE